MARFACMAVVCLALATVAAAQPTTAPATASSTTQPTTAPAPAGPPGVGDVVNLIDRVTSPVACEDPSGWSAPIKMAIVFAALALLPSLLVMMTSFTRIIIVLSFVRRALTTQNIPPTIALIGLSLFLTLFTMSPTFALVDRDAIQPYLAEEVEFDEACSLTMGYFRDLMVRQTREADLAMFTQRVQVSEDLPTIRFVLTDEHVNAFDSAVCVFFVERLKLSRLGLATPSPRWAELVEAWASAKLGGVEGLAG